VPPAEVTQAMWIRVPRREGNKKNYSLNLQIVKLILDLAEKHVMNYCAPKLRKKARLTYDDSLDGPARQLKQNTLIPGVYQRGASIQWIPTW